jgi:eukaryotic-like serine/threonine-protein kinase
MHRTLDDDNLAGETLDGRYRVDARVARGGMATVYRATDTRLDRTVALKVMHPELARHDEFVSRFIREAKTAARLTHPNIVSVFDQSADGGHVYLVMEYVDGHTLRDLLVDERRLTPREALEVMGPLLSALGAAHRAGMVHRDVKPENVLIAREGNYAHAVKVADFGLARSAAAGATVSLAGMIVGTASYLAPEQVKSGVCDARSDVYSAGVVLFEMLTGSKPFVADTPIQVAYRHVHDHVPPPSTLVPGLDPALDALVVRATSQDPSGRPGDANAFHAEVARTVASLPDSALDFGAGPRTPDQATTKLLVVDPDELGGAGAEGHGGKGGRGGQGRPVSPTRVMPVPDPTRIHAQPPPKKPAKQVYAPRKNANEPRRLVSEDQKWRPSRGHVALAFVLVVAAVIGITAWWYSSGRFRAMPGLLDQPKQSAIDILTQDGLHSDVTYDFDDHVKAGNVVKSSPDAHHHVLRGGTVKLVVSKGPHPVAVPDETGQSPDVATQRLQAAGFSVGIAPDQVFSETVDAGEVAAQSPAMQQPGSLVTLSVSKGQEPFQVPDVVGLSLDDAQAKLLAAGFTDVDVNKWLFGGPVRAQNPAAGAYARHKDRISIYQSLLS